jgi:hypothetical protein
MTQQKENKPRRLKLFVVGEEDVFALLTREWVHETSTVVCVPHVPELPTGSIVHAVNYDFSIRGFAFLVEHESFDEVPSGFELKRIVIKKRHFQIKEIPFKEEIYV